MRRIKFPATFKINVKSLELLEINYSRNTGILAIHNAFDKTRSHYSFNFTSNVMYEIIGGGGGGAHFDF